MQIWIVVWALASAGQALPAQQDGARASQPLRYRGVERLLAKFEAEQAEDAVASVRR